MSATRLLVSFVVASLMVLTMLVVSVNTFYNRNTEAIRPPMDSIEVEYLTPEEAARLLGADADISGVPGEQPTAVFNDADDGTAEAPAP
ncbi:MAG: hypothetical protein OER80_10240 [Gammaproteobacteria bacterium]|nr:hypothetical protein [Gammaproteobacteria bacterium]MDH3767908.1 hypothetical protein [Gammaproteobacteria bacterium]